MATFSRRVAVLALGSATSIIAVIAGPISSASAAALAQPVNLAPDSAGGSPSDPTQVQKDPILSWDTVPGAGAYRVEIGRTTNWTDSTVLVSLPNKGLTNVPRFVVPQTLNHGDYFWRVRAENGSTTSPWSAAAQLFRGWFDAPTDGPAPGADATADWRSDPNGVQSAPFRLSWTAIPDASSYEFELSTEKTFPQPGTVQDGKTVDGSTTVVCITTHTTFTPYGSVSGEDAGVDKCDLSKFDAGFAPFYWRVRGLDDSSTTAPGNDETQSTLCLGVPGDPAQSPPTANTTVALGTPSTPAQECSRWSPAVQTQWPVSGSGDFSPDLITTAPNASLSCTVCTDMPEVRWSPYSPDGGTTFAGLYEVTIADDPDFTNVERIYNTTLLTLTPRDQLAENTAGDGYWVAVQACATPTVGQIGCGQPAVMHFTKQTPQVTGLTATSLPSGVQFSWSDLLGKFPASSLTAAGGPAVEALEYRVELAKTTDPDFSQPVHVFTVDRACATQFAGACYQPGVSNNPGISEAIAHVADGSYLWRVVPVDVAGNHLHPSFAQQVDIDTTAPVFRLTDASPASVASPLHVSVNDSALNGNVAQSLKVVPVVGGGTVAGAWHQTSATTWTFTPSSLLVPGQSYALKLVGLITDQAGNAAVVSNRTVRANGRAEDNNRVWHYSSGWKQVSASGALGGTFHRGSRGATATVHVVGTSLSVYACKAPHSGRMTIKVDGTTVSSPSLSQSFTKCGLRIFRGGVSGTAVHTVRITATGGPIDLDRVAIS